MIKWFPAWNSIHVHMFFSLNIFQNSYQGPYCFLEICVSRHKHCIFCVNSWRSIKWADKNCKNKFYPCKHREKKKKKKEMFCKYVIRKKFQQIKTLYAVSFSKDELLETTSANPVLIYHMGFVNVMKMKSKLPPFSLIHIRCQCAFCFWFQSLLLLSKFWYTLKDCILGHCKLHVWDHVLHRLTWNYLWAVWQDMQFLASLIWTPNSLY